MHGAAIPSFDGDRRAVVMRGALTTQRLQLTPVCEGDLEELYALHADPRAFAEDLTAPLADREQMRWVLAQWIGSWREHGIGYFGVRPRAAGADGAAGAEALAQSPALLGVVGLTPMDLEGRQVLSAYWRLVPAATGRGIAAEAMGAVLAQPHPGRSDREVIAVTAAGNRPSRALAARLGFAPAAAERAVPGGRAGDVLLLRPPDQPPRRPGVTT